MKFKLKEKNYINILLIIALCLSLIFAFTSSFYMHSLSGNENELDKTPIKASKEKHENIKKYIKENNNILVEETEIEKEIIDVVTKDDEKYESKIFDYNTGEELKIDDLLKDNTKEDFDTKIEELLYLKYPNFIADVLKTDEGDKVYSLKKNELIIYYYNYVIDPMPNEELFLKVNYNEIKDFLNITVELDLEYQNEDGSIIDPSKKLIAITFDDGPGPYTQELVDILINNKAHATFFMLGRNVSKYKNSVLKVYNNDMEIAYHSYAHTSFKRQTIEEIKTELDESNEILKEITGDTFHLIRPPYGAINQEIKESLDTPFILWYVDTEDWRHKDIDYLTNYTMEHVKDGYIILFHDIHKTSVDAMNKILPLLYVNGYQVLTVSKLAETFNVTLENHSAYRHFVR